MSFLFSGKERDNTWLQLQVCPTELRSPRELCQAPTETCPYAHPPEHVIKHVLTNGCIVSCHDFVFSHGSNKRGCTRYELFA